MKKIELTIEDLYWLLRNYATDIEASEAVNKITNKQTQEPKKECKHEWNLLGTDGVCCIACGMKRKHNKKQEADPKREHAEGDVRGQIFTKGKWVDCPVELIIPVMVSSPKSKKESEAHKHDYEMWTDGKSKTYWQCACGQVTLDKPTC